MPSAAEFLDAPPSAEDFLNQKPSSDKPSAADFLDQPQLPPSPLDEAARQMGQDSLYEAMIRAQAQKAPALFEERPALEEPGAIPRIPKDQPLGPPAARPGFDLVPEESNLPDPDKPLVPIGDWLIMKRTGDDALRHPELAGVEDSIRNTLNSLTTPENLALLGGSLGVGSLGPLAARAVSLGFALMMAKQAPEIATQLGEEMGKAPEERDQRKIAQLVSDAVTTTGFVGSAGLHAVNPAGALGESPRLRPTPSLGRAVGDVFGQMVEASKSVPEAIEAQARMGGEPIVEQVATPRTDVEASAAMETPAIDPHEQALARRAAIKAARPVVPETPAEPNRGMTVLEEIWQAGAKTVRDIQRLFPERGLSKEEARALRDQAYPPETETEPGPGEAEPTTEEEQHAEQDIETTRTDVDVQHPEGAGEGEGEVPADEGGAGVPPRGQGETLPGPLEADVPPQLELALGEQPTPYGAGGMTPLERQDLAERYGTRNPTAQSATERATTHPTVVDMASMARNPEAMQRAAQLIRKYYKQALTGLGKLSDEQTVQALFNHVVDNLKWLHDRMPPEVRARARKWYDGARRITEGMSTYYGVGRRTAATVMALLSPQRDWFQNVSLAHRVLEIVTKRRLAPWTDAMTDTLKGWLKNPDLNAETKTELRRALPELKASRFKDLDDFGKSVFVRAYSEAHMSPNYRVLAPEGHELELARNKGEEGEEGKLGEPSRVGWPSFPQISKAVQAIEHPERDLHSDLLGNAHKIRNFANNILLPNDPRFGDVTIDTHAIAAALLKALGGKGREVLHNFGRGKKGELAPVKDSVNGFNGLYPIFADAYREAARQRRLLPRELQSITWEGGRGLFTDVFKRNEKSVAAVNKVWNSYARNERTIGQARKEIERLAGGIKQPEWMGRGAGPYEEAQRAGDVGQLPGAGVPGPKGPGRGGAGAAAGAVPGRVSTPVRLREQAFLDTDGGQEVAKVYGTDPTQVQVSTEPYVQGDLPFGGEGGAAGQPGGGGAGPKLSQQELSRRALGYLLPQHLQAALARRRRISSIEPKRVPQEIPEFKIHGTVINNAADFVRTLIALRSPYNESLKVALLDKDRKVVHSQVLYSGTLDTTSVDFRDIARLKALHPDAVAMVMSHNHPSGEVAPSEADIRVTNGWMKMAKAAGFQVLDHVITNGEKYYSFASDAQHDIEKPELAPWENMPRSERPVVKTEHDFGALVKNLRQANHDVSHIVYLDTRLHVTAIERVQPDVVRVAKAALNGIGLEGARGIAIDYGPTIETTVAAKAARGLRDLLKTTGSATDVFDFASQDMMSGKSAGYFYSEEPPKAGPEGEALGETRRRFGQGPEGEPPRRFEQSDTWEKMKALADVARARAEQQPGGPKTFRMASGGAGLQPPRAAPPVTRTVPAPAGPAPAITRQQLAPALSHWGRLRQGFQSIFSPQNIDPIAKAFSFIMRENNARQALDLVRADKELGDLRGQFDRNPVPKDWTYDPAQPLPHNYAVMDALEQNRAALPRALQDWAQAMDKEFAWRIAEVQKLKPGALQQLIQNYFPHMWEKPDSPSVKSLMAEVAARAPFEGSRAFLRQRTLPLTVDGLARGLKPISDNPVDLVLAKLHQMDKFIMAQRTMAEAKQLDYLKYFPLGRRIPAGRTIVDDPSFTVHAPPFLPVAEAYDAGIRRGLLDFMQKMGFRYQRVQSLGVDTWGQYTQGGKVQAKFGSPDFVIMHEIGHGLEERYGLTRYLLSNDTLRNEMAKLADLRGQGISTTRAFKKYIQTPDEQVANAVHAYIYAPELMEKVAPNVRKVVRNIIRQHPELEDLNEIKPGLALASQKMNLRLAGPVLAGHWTLPDGAASVLTNYLSPGLGKFQAFRALRTASNVLNGAQLGLSAFHAGFTSLDAVVSSVATGLGDALRGDLFRAGKTLAMSPTAPFLNYYMGKAVQMRMVDPMATHLPVMDFPAIGIKGFRVPLSPRMSALADQVAQLAVKGGMRAEADPFWRTQITRNLLRAIHEGGVVNYAKAGLSVPWAAVEQAMRPIAEYLVPRQKLGVFAQLAQQEMRRIGMNAGPMEVRAAMARAADSTEDRMGQMTYDNLFYNKMVKDISLLGFRAYGWQLGKYRAMFGAGADTVNMLRGRNGVTNRMLYPVALTMTAGVIGALTNRLLTGEWPQSRQDYFMPRNGQMNKDGTPQRLMLPTYLKDLISDWHDFPSLQKMGANFYHKLNPWVATVVDMLRNRDYYDVDIRQPDDSVGQQMADLAKYAAKAFVPFSVSGTMKLSDSGSPLSQLVLPFFGVVPAKRALTMTPAQTMAADITRAGHPEGGRTRASADHGELLRTIAADLRQGIPGAELPPELKAQMRAGDWKTVLSMKTLSPMQYQVHKMEVDDAMRVWRLANPEERQLLHSQMVIKVGRSKTITPEKRAAYFAELRQ